MGNLPVSRTENCVAGAPVNHNLINEIQDVLISDIGADITDHVPLHIFVGTNWAPVSASSLLYLESSGAGACYIAIPSRSGRVIRSVTFAMRGALGTEHFNNIIVYQEFKDATAQSPIGTLTGGTLPTPTVTWADVTVDVTDTTVTDAFDLYLFLDGGSTGLRVKNIRAVYGHV